MALVLCAVAIVTLVLAVVGANVRSPRTRRARAGIVLDDRKQLRPPPADAPAEK